MEEGAFAWIWKGWVVLRYLKVEEIVETEAWNKLGYLARD